VKTKLQSHSSFFFCGNQPIKLSFNHDNSLKSFSMLLNMAMYLVLGDCWLLLLLY